MTHILNSRSVLQYYAFNFAGIGASVNQGELQLISSPPQTIDKNYFLAPTFAALSGITNTIAQASCNVAAPCKYII